jgi:hypothetical protein
MQKVINMSAHAVLTPAVLREKASHARACARYLPAYDEAVERLLDFAAELEARAGVLERRSGCISAQPAVDSHQPQYVSGSEEFA